ncbi:MAG: hypothetical protein JXR96_24970 [Deltaproteobacteria bacterium]|nr:hypothetical protein [Deltaproteobacteria bacterium]
MDILAHLAATAWKREYRRPPDEQARAIRAAFTARLWEQLEPLSLTERACAWLEARGLRPALAHALGFRDWRPVMTWLKQALEPLSPPERVATGLFFEGGSLWWPLSKSHACRSEYCRPELASTDDMPERARGLCAPVWDGALAHPLGWLWQLYEPVSKSRYDNCMRYLARGQPTLLGICTGASGLPAASAHPMRIVCEEPIEWLSLVQAAAGRAAVMGILRSWTFWNEDWTPHLAGAERVAIALPEREGYAERVFAALEKSADARFGPGWAEAHLQRRTLEGEDACNALLQRGELAGLVDELLDP